MLIVCDLQSITKKPPVMDIQKQQLAKEKLAISAADGLEKSFNLRAPR